MERRFTVKYTAIDWEYSPIGLPQIIWTGNLECNGGMGSLHCQVHLHHEIALDGLKAVSICLVTTAGVAKSFECKQQLNASSYSLLTLWSYMTLHRFKAAFQKFLHLLRNQREIVATAMSDRFLMFRSAVWMHSHGSDSLHVWGIRFLQAHFCLITRTYSLIVRLS